MTEDQITTPEITFHRLLKSAKQPILADNSAHGLLPTRAYRFCEAARVASSLGWYVFPPVAFSVLYDGAAVYWRFEHEDWKVLDNAVLVSDAENFDNNCRDDLKGYCPPFLGAAENGVLQIMSGLAVKTSPGWGVLIRRPPNIPSKNQIEHYEGYIETDNWLGPLFTNIRILKTDTEVRFETDWPYAFVQPLPHQTTRKEIFQNVTLKSELNQFNTKDWDDLSKTLVDRNGPESEKAKYAKQIRRMHKSPK